MCVCGAVSLAPLRSDELCDSEKDRMALGWMSRCLWLGLMTGAHSGLTWALAVSAVNLKMCENFRVVSDGSENSPGDPVCRKRPADPR